MKKVYKLTLRSFIGPFIATFFICLFLILMQFLWKHIDDMIGKGIEPFVILKLLFYASASFIPLALPLAVLLSSMMTLGGLAENQELMAFKSAGISLMRVMVPLILIIATLSVGAFFFSNLVIPKANLKFGSLLWDVREQKPALDLQEGIFYNQIDGYSIRVEQKEKGGAIRDVLIYDHTQGNTSNVVLRADSGKMFTTPGEEYLILNLFSGERYEALSSDQSNGSNFPHTRLQFDDYSLRFSLSGFNLDRTKEALFKHHFQMLSVEKLSRFTDSLKKELTGRQRRMEEYLDPYFRQFRDSAFFKGPALPVPPDTASLAARLDTANPRQTLDRAKGMAESVQGVLSVHSGRVASLKEHIAEYNLAWYKKFKLSMVILALFFIGAPLGAIIRKGGLGLPAIASIVLFLIYHVLSMTGRKMAEDYVMNLQVGVWLPLIVLAPIGIAITYMANRDVNIFNKENYRWLLKLIPGMGRAN